MPKEDGQFKKGVSKGRPKGTPNKLGKSVRETVLAVFNEMQKEEDHSLRRFAEKYPRDFYAIAAKLIPTEITGTIKNVIKVKISDE